MLAVWGWRISLALSGFGEAVGRCRESLGEDQGMGTQQSPQATMKGSLIRSTWGTINRGRIDPPACAGPDSEQTREEFINQWDMTCGVKGEKKDMLRPGDETFPKARGFNGRGKMWPSERWKVSRCSNISSNLWACILKAIGRFFFFLSTPIPFCRAELSPTVFMCTVSASLYFFFSVKFKHFFFWAFSRSDFSPQHNRDQNFRFEVLDMSLEEIQEFIRQKSETGVRLQGAE